MRVFQGSPLCRARQSTLVRMGVQSAPMSHWSSRLHLPRRSASITRSSRLLCLDRGRFSRTFFTSPRQQKKKLGKRSFGGATVVLIIGGLLVSSTYPGGEVRQARLTREANDRVESAKEDEAIQAKNQAAWLSFAGKFETFSNVADIEWSTLPDKIADIILPDWAKTLPMYVRKLQGELSMAPGSLADEIWRDAHDPYINPEIRYKSKVRVSDQLCDEEKEFLARRKKVATAALAKYLGLDEDAIHPEDVPTIAMCGSGGGLRALVAGTGSLLATQEDGLFDCVTYTAGVSGSCWLQSLYHSSITEQRLDRVIEHMKDRLGIHIAYPPAAFSSVLTAPTNKLLLSSMVEKLKGDPNADFGLVDVYGILLAARLLVPRGELGVNDRDFKLSNQRDYIQYGQNPLPIYTAVRHEIPDVTQESGPGGPPSEKDKEVAKKEAWFQWFEITPYEFFCEEFNAGIPTWAMGRNFKDGIDVPPESGFHLPEPRMSILMGIFGSAFCASLSLYYREIRPLVKSLTGFSTVDEMIHGRNEDLEKVHPIEPASIPNFVYGMDDELRFTTPTDITKAPYIQLMDAGMSNNLPIYPLLRPGRGVDIIIAFDASADIKTDNWLSVADGYARQRNIKGWPVGVGWPKAGEAPEKTERQLDAAQADSTAEADSKLFQAQQSLETGQPTDAANQESKSQHDQSHPEDSDLGYCTIWVGSTQERSSEPPPPTKAIDKSSHWQLMESKAGIAVVYLPFMANEKVDGVDPAKSDYMSTWNFVYTPEQIDKVVELARANFEEGKEQIRGCVRAVYERKKRIREEREEAARGERRRRLVRLGVHGKLGEGDHFS